MSTHRIIDRLCVAAIVLALILTLVFANGEAFGIQKADRVMGYENRLFDTSKVHTIDIVMDDWQSFIESCEDEEYSACAVVIDGEAYKNVGIRAKGNTSLNTVSSLNSDRYSFKIEFDQYDNTGNYYGLDKLSLNNIIQDTTFMKDYLTYRMMGEFGVSAPLCSYAYITVNGEEWGLYLAVEGVEDAFLQRNYGGDFGDLYKPDSMSFGGGGPGHGRNFDMDEFMQERRSEQAEQNTDNAQNGVSMQQRQRPQRRDDDLGQGRAGADGEGLSRGGFGGGPGGGPGGSMGSSDVKLQYIDDDPESYSNIFSSVKTELTETDQNRLIASLKALSEGERIEDVVDIDKVIRYFVVHNFVVNDDSYTGSMIHNYYLYEQDGKMEMIPWDYNLAYGTFQSSNSTDAVNAPIDTPVSGGIGEDRPMVSWIFQNEHYTELYHKYFEEFLTAVDHTEIIDRAAELIAPYVERDPRKFYSYEEFESGVETLREFCRLRTQSVAGQLSGEIAATTEGQQQDASSLIDASGVTLSDMGAMGGGGGGAPGRIPGENTAPQSGMPFGGSPPGMGSNNMPPEMTQDMRMPGSEGTMMQPMGAPPQGGSSPQGSAGSQPAQSGNGIALPAVSTGVLLIGIIFAVKFKRYSEK